MSEFYPNGYPNDYTAPQSPTAPTYTAPDMASPPPYVPDAAPGVAPRRRNPLPLIVGALLVLIAVIAGALYLFTKAPQQAGALLAARGFCTAEQQPDYAKAYTYFAPTLQTSVPQEAFVAISQGVEKQQGKVTNCSPNGVDVSKDGKSAIVHGSLKRQNTPAQNVDLSFTQSNGSWKIDKSPDAALLPLTTAYRFCRDIRLNQFDAAYALMSTNLQSSFGSAQSLQQDLTTIAQVTGTVSNCAAQGFTLDASKQSGTVQALIDFTNFQGVGSKLYEVVDGTGNWKLDALEFDIAGNPVKFPFGS